MGLCALFFLILKAFHVVESDFDYAICLTLLALDSIFWAVVNVVTACRSIAWSERERIRIHRQERE